ncbi:lysophospholipid acyltransferase family protein [Pilimelia columellifera]|uniref:Lysophospholipid acyltransferase family protein n=1 Tax=Pilimelia columellifera subsp. columellifera TaxID=706583 RepID=A0ABN3NQB4_9ACTN
MSELVYPPVIATVNLMFRALDLRVRVDGAEHIPATGGAVLASNHVSYLDFIFCGFGARPAGRLVRFMAKHEVFEHPVGGPLMRGMRHIPVDRSAGATSLRAALQALRAGEVVGVFPEATISRSFTVKELKTGSGRMAANTGTPLIPVAVWGTHRLWTKGRPRTLLRRHLPVTVMIGEPMDVGRKDDQDVVMAELRARMMGLLDRAQRDYPDQPSGPEDTWWLPAHLGGTAPTPEQAAAEDARSGDDD